jgi:hypothetical protein
MAKCSPVIVSATRQMSSNHPKFHHLLIFDGAVKSVAVLRRVEECY